MRRLVRPIRPWLRRPRGLRGGGARGVRPSLGRGFYVLLSAVIGIGIALLTIQQFDAEVRPLAAELAGARAKNAITQIINDTVNETLISQTVAYDDIVSLQKDEAGRITAMSTSSANMNALRSEILTSIVEQVSTLDTYELGIPLGNLTSLVAVSDRGPRLPVRVHSIATSDASFQSVFTSQGINQTLHQVLLEVQVTVRLLIPGGTVEQKVSAQVSVAETVIVGQVPESYLQLGNRS